jgi:holliday junction DNA helicase RuvB
MVNPEDTDDRTIRPNKLDEFTGQGDIKENLKITIDAAKQRGEPIDHCLLVGMPGLGKTTLANIIATEMGVNIHSTIGTLLKKPKDIITLLTQINEGDIIFIDEIHRINPVVEEFFYTAMEDGFIDVLVSENKNARTVKLNIEPFTLIGATTKQGLLGAPFRGRFGIIATLNPYTHNELVTITKRSASIMKITISDDGAEEIASRSRGTPRVVNRLLRRVRDYAVVKHNGKITQDLASQALDKLKIDKIGLDETDRKILSIIAKDYNGKPVGLKTIAISIGEDVRTIEDVYEPYLIQRGLLIRTPLGREVTTNGKMHIKMENTNGTKV